MDQLPPLSHWATASQTESALAVLAVAMPPTTVAAPTMPTPARRDLMDRVFAMACLGL